MVREIVQIGDSILTEISPEVPKSDLSQGKYQKLIDDLLDTLRFHDKSAAGLSAVQIGALERIFVIKNKSKKNSESTYEVLVNPVPVDKSEELSTIWEGCMSISDGDMRLYGPVSRPSSTTFEYLDRYGVAKTMSVSGFHSHLLQHEQDHLDGKLFLTYISNPQNIWKEDELDEYLEIYGKYPGIR